MRRTRVLGAVVVLSITVGLTPAGSQEADLEERLRARSDISEGRRIASSRIRLRRST